jgi:hypothetical protein
LKIRPTNLGSTSLNPKLVPINMAPKIEQAIFERLFWQLASPGSKKEQTVNPDKRVPEISYLTGALAKQLWPEANRKSRLGPRHLSLASFLGQEEGTRGSLSSARTGFRKGLHFRRWAAL